jgi:hypothetical protein
MTISAFVNLYEQYQVVADRLADKQDRSQLAKLESELCFCLCHEPNGQIVIEQDGIPFIFQVYEVKIGKEKMLYFKVTHTIAATVDDSDGWAMPAIGKRYRKFQ